ncbi:MAG TPA: electron transfer flavoprotein subunit alpha/FixB family protein [Candidatus Lokiarchaeia archaeon]|nr:electron transfer flavoprotein subunit alpha/FixB family protein [Candidatus Lokiarchaeia archaeon]
MMACSGEYHGIWIYVSHSTEKIHKSTLELLAKGRELAGKLNVELSALLVGADVAQHADQLVYFGADKVYVAEDELLREYSTIPYAEAVTQLIQREKPEIVLFPADIDGRDLAPRVAARLETGLTADCTDLDIGEFTDKQSGTTYENILYQIRPAFGGDIIATIVNPDCRPQMATVRPGTFIPLYEDASRTGEVIPCDVQIQASDLVAEVVEVIQEEKESNLEGARVIVTGGRGVGGAEGFKLLKELADLLGGEVGASRGAVEAGWISYAHQVGQSGQTVAPDLYIACGVSGAIQHLVGIKNARKIIAINKDPNAQIFNAADYCICGDLFDVLPQLIAKVKSARENS